MKIVLDTNVIVRLLIKPDGIVAALFYAVNNKHDLYACDFSFEEIAKHKKRLLKASKLTGEEFEIMYTALISSLSVVPLEIIPNSIFLRSFQYASSTDLDDIPFVATAILLEGFLWTSDKKLFDGLKKRGFGLVLNNSDIRKFIS
jgi:predicted nucleic acid-binding protein